MDGIENGRLDICAMRRRQHECAINIGDSVCHCEAYNVTHSDFICGANRTENRLYRMLPVRTGCKKVKSDHVAFSKFISTDKYCLQFRNNRDPKKIDTHYLPPVGRCLISSQLEKEKTVFQFYEVPSPSPDSLQPTLSFSIKNGGNENDCMLWERCLQTELQVNCYSIYDISNEVASNVSNQCLLHITPHYICMTNRNIKCNLTMLSIIQITNKTKILYNNIEGNAESVVGSEADLVLEITSYHNEEESVSQFALRTSTLYRDAILNKLKHYVTNRLTDQTQHQNQHQNGNNQCVDNCNNSYEDFVPPEIDRSHKPTPKPRPPGPKQIESKRNEYEGRVWIQYDNIPMDYDGRYENVNLKINEEALSLTVFVFASTPILKDIWLLEIIFIQSKDIESLSKTLKETQVSCGRHSVVPGRPIKALTGIVVDMEIKTAGFQLLSGTKHISYDKLNVISDVSWLVVEAVIMYNGNAEDDVQFHSVLKLKSEADGVDEEISILDKFKGLKKEGMSCHGAVQSSPLSQTVIFPLPYAARIQFCELLDMTDTFGKDWKLFADTMGLTYHQICVIENNKVSSCTESVLRHLEVHLPQNCQYDYIIDSLNGKMGRTDIIDLLVACNEHAVEHEQ